VKAYIIGNGLSRSEFDLEKLRGKGTIFGCNALYRDFTPDYLVAIDDKIISEINHAIDTGNCGVPQSNFIVPSWNECFEATTGRRSNAGMNAMLEAIKLGHDEIYCLGFDFLIDDEISVKNVYDGTSCYGAETRAVRADNSNRAAYLEYVALNNRDVSFAFVYPQMDNFKLLTVSCDNVFGMFYDTFEERVLNGD
jgi:hypothetical protein